MQVIMDQHELTRRTQFSYAWLKAGIYKTI